MSTQPLSDRAKTALLTDLVRDLHPQHSAQGGGSLSSTWAVLHEVPPETGWPGGYADVVALHLWPSELKLVGYEVKASRGDLKKELSQPEKHQRVARFCDAWWLVVWDRAWVDGPKALPDIPEDWGLLAYDSADGLTTVRRCAPRSPQPWPRTFTAALVRRALEASAGVALTHRLHRAAYGEGEIAGTHDGRREARAAALATLAPWRDAIRRENAQARELGQWPHHDPDSLDSVLRYLAERAPAPEVAQLTLEVSA